MANSKPRVWADESGVWREDRPGAIFGIQWEEIFAISVQKIDLIDSESIVLSLDWDFGEYVEIVDFSIGFDQVVRKLEARYPEVADAFEAGVSRLEPGGSLTIWRRT